MLALALLLWGAVGALPAALFFGIGILIRLFFHMRNLAALDRWLVAPEERPVPDGKGLWEDVFSQLNKLTKAQRLERAQRSAALSQMKQATSALPEGVAILDEADRIEW